MLRVTDANSGNFRHARDRFVGSLVDIGAIGISVGCAPMDMHLEIVLISF